MKKLFTLVFVFLSFASTVSSSPKLKFDQLLIRSEMNPNEVILARQEAIRQGLPVYVLTSDRIMIDAKAMEDGKIVYSVITNFADPYNGGHTAFYDDAIKLYNTSNARIDYGNGNITDNTGGLFTPVISSVTGIQKFLMIPDWTFDRVYLFNYDNGDLVDTAFISHSSPQLQSPKHALQLFNGTQIVVSDQISDLVQRYDTNGTYIGFFAPSTGVNTSILDNIRGIRFLSNRNLLVTVASGASMNTIQQFDTGGVSIGAFITGNLNSPFDILLRENDILISNFTGSNRISRFDNAGNFLNSFYTGSDFALPQQLHRLDNGNILAAAFSTPSGLAVLDSTGVFKRLLTGATGLRGAHLLGNGRYMVTNGSGVHEIDSATGNIIRTIVTGNNYQFISLYDPDMIVSIGNQSNQIVTGFKLYSNYPNPFNPVTKIKFDITRDGRRETRDVKLVVFDALGKEVSTILNQKLSQGSYEVEFDGSDFPSGIYFYKLEVESFSETKRMILLK